MGNVATLRQAVIAAVSLLDGWTLSKFAPELFGRDTDQLSHHSFTVGIPSTEPRDAEQSLAWEMLSASTVEVQWAHRLRGDAQSADYDAACDAEQDVVKAVIGISSQHFLVTRLVRAAKAEGWVTGTATFSAIHRYALA